MDKLESEHFLYFGGRWRYVMAVPHSAAGGISFTDPEGCLVPCEDVPSHLWCPGEESSLANSQLIAFRDVGVRDWTHRDFATGRAYACASCSFVRFGRLGEGCHSSLGFQNGFLTN